MLLHNKQVMRSAIPIHLTNGYIITQSYKGILPNLPHISDEYKTCEIFSNNNDPALLFLG